MAFMIYEFDGVALPQYNAEQDDNSATVEPSLVDSIGGVTDYFGPGQRLPRKNAIEISGLYFGETVYMVDEDGAFIVTDDGTFIIAGEGANILRSQLQAIRSKVGVRGTLKRKRQDDGAVEWITARLLRIEHPHKQEEMARRADVTCAWESAMGAWRAETMTTTSKSCSAASNALTVSNSGDVQVRDAIFTFTASAAVSSVRVECVALGVDWTWTGALSSGQALVVDAGAQTVRKAGSDAYSGFVFNSAHSAAGFLPLDPGANPLVVTVDGTGTAKVEHYNQWL
jgi:hypothetical protein